MFMNYTVHIITVLHYSNIFKNLKKINAVKKKYLTMCGIQSSIMC